LAAETPKKKHTRRRTSSKGDVRTIREQDMLMCHAYLENGLNKSEALRTVMPQSKTWKQNSVYTRAAAIFARPEVKEYLNSLRNQTRQKAEEKLAINTERVLRELARIAFSDIRKIFDSDSNLMKVADVDDDTAASISSIEVITKPSKDSKNDAVETVVKIKCYDKIRALDGIGKYLGLYLTKTPPAEQGDGECKLLGASVPEWMRGMIPRLTE